MGTQCLGVKLGHPVNMGPCPLGKKLSVRKPEIWPRKGEEVHYGGEGSHWTVVPMKKNKKNIGVKRLRTFGQN